jgi:hypothetical protein
MAGESQIQRHRRTSPVIFVTVASLASLASLVTNFPDESGGQVYEETSPMVFASLASLASLVTNFAGEFGGQVYEETSPAVSVTNTITFL